MQFGHNDKKTKKEGSIPKGLKTLLISIVLVGALLSLCWFIGCFGWLADGKLPAWLEAKLDGISAPGGYGMVNRIGAKNPTYDELVEFIKKDQTDRTPYKMYQYSCLDYARDVHNNAEVAGIRAGIVLINQDSEWDFKRHALNALETVDKGLVFIDCTRYDTRAYVSIGEYYSIEPLYPRATNGFLFTFVGVVEEYRIQWW